MSSGAEHAAEFCRALRQMASIVVVQWLGSCLSLTMVSGVAGREDQRHDLQARPL